MLGVRGVKTTAFQKSGFQNNAFEISANVVGWMPRWHDPEELEERIKRRRANTFGPKWFDEFLKETLAKAAEVKSEPQREALVKAARAVAEAAQTIEPERLSDAVAALQRSLGASRVTASIKNAEIAVVLAKQSAEDDDDDDIAVMLLLNG
jgi:hypothetical protein